MDEASLLRLKHHGLEDSTLTTLYDDGFALRHGEAVDLAVAPAARQRGIGGELALQVFQGDGPVTAWSHGDHPAAAVLAERHRLRRARELWVMRRPASEPLPELVVPDGITVRGYRDEDRDEVLRVNAAAFAHHPEQGSLDAEGLADADGRGVVRPGRAAGRRRRRRAARASTGPSSTTPSLGEVYVVAIDPAAQGQGLGRVLTLAGLRHLHGLGVGEVLLYVESDNSPAVHVYEGLGFAHAAADTHVQYRRP